MRKELLKISLFGMLLLAGVQAQAQKVAEKKADKEYQTQAYVDAIKIYERIAGKGYTNADMLKKLADAYYFNGKLPEANQWYAQLFDGEYDDKGKEAIPSEYYYRYAQTLKSVENYDKSGHMMQEFAKLEGNDSRAQLFEASKDRYLKEIENNSDRYDLKNIGVNTAYSDYGATLYGDQLIYTSARQTDHQSGKRLHDWTNESFTSLFSTKINADGTFDEPVKFAPELDTKVNEATAVFTADGKTMYFTRNNTSVKGKRRLNKENSTLLKIYKATLSEEGKWVNVEELPFNSDNFNTAHPALTPDDKWLYFSSDREGTIGQSDIFRVALYPTGEYGSVENVGKKVNTSGRETFPFISKDHFLFFSSDGHPGLGGLDVFVAKINVDGSIGQVTNMGTPINSSTDDFGFYVDKKTRKGFVSSNRANSVGGDDIYFFMEKVCHQILEGIVLDKDTQEVLANAKVTIYNNAYTAIGELITDDKGYYRVEDLDCNKKYRLKAEAPKYNTEEVLVLMDAKAG
ncbi:MAG: carboxypeptidase regulatory-like domain-containing protein, partial [Flavobacterium sp.]